MKPEGSFSKSGSTARRGPALEKELHITVPQFLTTAMEQTLPNRIHRAAEGFMKGNGNKTGTQLAEC